jgi:hypothetical protein
MYDSAYKGNVFMQRGRPFPFGDVIFNLKEALNVFSMCDETAIDECVNYRK